MILFDFLKEHGWVEKRNSKSCTCYEKGNLWLFHRTRNGFISIMLADITLHEDACDRANPIVFSGIIETVAELETILQVIGRSQKYSFGHGKAGQVYEPFPL